MIAHIHLGDGFGLTEDDKARTSILNILELVMYTLNIPAATYNENPFWLLIIVLAEIRLELVTVGDCLLDGVHDNKM